jgi:hypothetical protein
MSGPDLHIFTLKNKYPENFSRFKLPVIVENVDPRIVASVSLYDEA